MQLVREKVYAMEQTHMALKQKYYKTQISQSHPAIVALRQSLTAMRQTGLKKRSPTFVASSNASAEAPLKVPWSARLPTLVLLRHLPQPSAWEPTPSAPS